jgi:hypothetical protein
MTGVVVCAVVFAQQERKGLPQSSQSGRRDNGEFCACGLVDFEGVADVEGEFSVDAKNFYGAVDGVNVHDSDCAGRGADGVEKFFVVGDDFDGHVRLVELGDGGLGFGWFDTEKFLKRHTHFRSVRVFHNNDEGFAIGPGFCGAFAKFGEIGQRHILKFAASGSDDRPITNSRQRRQGKRQGNQRKYQSDNRGPKTFHAHAHR